MLRSIIFYISFIFLVSFQTGYANISNQSIPCAPELQRCLSKIQQLPEARNLIATIQKEGQIRIIINNDPYLTKDFGAFWDMNNRVITVNYSKNIPEGSLIGSIIFEMHNALVNSKMIKLDNLAAAGKIDRDTYVEEFERLEYKNSKNASKLAFIGIQRGIFPLDAYMHTYPDFEEHFLIQKLAGHSEFIARNYDYIAQQKNQSYR